jgi:hypothetical protein
MNFRGKISLRIARKAIRPALFALMLPLVTSCGEHETPAERDAKAHLFKAKAPHGGYSVPLGDDAYQMEFVIDSASGRMDAYILDAEMENYVRISAPSFDVAVQLPDGTNIVHSRLHFVAVANPATGETVGKTSQFEAQAEWLKGAHSFAGVLQEINVEGTTFNGVYLDSGIDVNKTQ